MKYKIFLQNVRYRHRQNTKASKCKLAYMRYIFSVISQKTYTARVSYCQNSDIREVSILLV